MLAALLCTRVLQPQPQGGGGDSKKRPKGRTIKFSDFAHQQEREAAMLTMLPPKPVTENYVSRETIDEFADDDEIILLTITRILH